MEIERDAGVRLPQTRSGGFRFRFSDCGIRVKELALEIRGIDVVGIEETQPPDARGSEVKRGGRAESAGSDEEDGSIFQAQLPGLADLRNQEVAGVAGFLFGAEHALRLTLKFQNSNFNEEEDMGCASCDPIQPFPHG
jgi:hypothetical protein